MTGKYAATKWVSSPSWPVIRSYLLAQGQPFVTEQTQANALAAKRGLGYSHHSSQTRLSSKNALPSVPNPNVKTYSLFSNLLLSITHI